MAYSSTAMLCAKEGIVSGSSALHNSTLSIFFVLLLGSVTIASMAFNFKGKRTMISLIIAGSGFLSTLTSVAYVGGEVLYYSGVLLFFLSVWWNGSLPWLIRSLKRSRDMPLRILSRS